MLKALIIYFICVLALTFGACWLTMLIHGTKLRIGHRTINYGPVNWPWWRAFAFGVCVLNLAAPSTGRQLWIYTRTRARCYGFVLDRSGQALKVENVEA